MTDGRNCLTGRILDGCKEKGIRVTSDMVTFLVSLLQLNPVYRVDEGKGEECFKGIIRAVTEKLEDQARPSLVALKNQLYFAKHYEDRDETVKKHRLSLHHKTRSLVTEICETSNVKTDRDIERLYQKILVVITLLSGLGNPTVAPILREVSVALQSIFQPSELLHFVALSQREKEEQLMEMMCIVAGIRLFNRDCMRGGEGIDDLPSILQEAVQRTHDAILKLLEELMTKVYKFTAVVEDVVTATLTTADSESCCRNSDDGTDEGSPVEDVCVNRNVKWAIEALATSRQQEIYIRKLLADAERCEREIKSLMQRFQGRLLKLHDTVRYRIAIPTTQVYPQFIDLADIWMGLQDEVIVLSNINNFLWELQSLSNKTVNECDRTQLDDILERDVEILTDAERLERSMGELIEECGECPVYYPNATKDFERISLEFLGFCAWKFVAGKGALIPGNPNNGIAKWRGKFYAFSSTDAARNFGKDPDRCIYMALDFARNHLEYVHLFQLYDDIENMRSQEELTPEGLQLKIRRNQNVQTDVHILSPHVDKDYSSNVWDLRKKALHLASISDCRTRSTQTYESNFRYGVHVQVAPPKDKEVQTRRDNYANTKKLLTFIFGLRGRRDDCQHVLSFQEDELGHP